ncbi:hypothetical protein [Corynebacterium glutamicum]|uniref:hypothetical protein n=1 Tax=Corynebacterium glutamicum TaxID=1718 RepID=UPI0012DA46AC|nr:hypothetical protein [Corynebacterium glutamicum]
MTDSEFLPAGYVDWIVDDLVWGTLSAPCASEAEARQVSQATGGGPIYRRVWTQIS